MMLVVMVVMLAMMLAGLSYASICWMQYVCTEAGAGAGKSNK